MAIDYTHQLNVLGAAIVVGTTEDDSKDMMMEAVGDNGRVDAMAAFKAMRSMIANRVEIALGRLPIAHRIALDLAIGDEVARRSARQAAGL